MKKKKGIKAGDDVAKPVKIEEPSAGPGLKVDYEDDEDEGKNGGEKDWEADSALDTLMRAKDIENNKELMARVHKKIGRKHSSIQSLKDTYDAKYGRGARED